MLIKFASARAQLFVGFDCCLHGLIYLCLLYHRKLSVPPGHVIHNQTIFVVVVLWLLEKFPCI